MQVVSDIEEDAVGHGTTQHDTTAGRTMSWDSPALLSALEALLKSDKVSL